MTTDSERREVARRLRGNPEDTLIPHRTGRHHGMGCREAADRFWNMCDLIKEAGNYDIAFSTTSVLADLIEPNCDRERLLAIATVMAADSVRSAKQGSSVSPVYILHAARAEFYTAKLQERCDELKRELGRYERSFEG